MESAQRELLSVLLELVCDRGLLSENSYLSAVDLVFSSAEVPELFRRPEGLTGEVSASERAAGTQ